MLILLHQLQGQTGVVGFSRLSFRLVTQKDLSFFRSNLAPDGSGRKQRPPPHPSVFQPGSYSGFWSLVGHREQDNPSSLFWIFLCCCVQLRTLQMSGYFGYKVKKPSEALDSNERLIGSVLVDTFRTLRYNMHAIVEQVPHLSDSYTSLIN